MMTTRRTFLVSLCIGSLIGMIPLLLKVRRDPFDAPSSYAVWGIGFLLAGFIVAFLKPQEAWRGAFGVGIGLAVSLAGHVLTAPESANLWPLSLIFSAVVGMPPAFAGAVAGKALAGLTKRTDHPTQRGDAAG
jgi:hypothetical protein